MSFDLISIVRKNILELSSSLQAREFTEGEPALHLEDGNEVKNPANSLQELVINR
jgi:hypothetical protein